MNYDIEAYLEGNLSGDALSGFEAEMQSNPEFKKDVDQQRELTERLKNQLLRAQVTQALNENGGAAKTGKSKGFWLLGLVLIGFVFGYFILPKESEKSVAPAIEEPLEATEKEIIPPTPPDELIEKPAVIPETTIKKDPPKPPSTQNTAPIAQGPSISTIPPPSYPAPNVRGSTASDAKWTAMRNAIWYTEFPPANTLFNATFEPTAQLLEERKFSRAYVRLQRLERSSPANDTLHFLKAYCLLEMGEGMEANRYFEKINTSTNAWSAQIEWYQALSFLLSGDKDNSQLLLQKIAADKNHPYYLQSLKALEMLP